MQLLVYNRIESTDNANTQFLQIFWVGADTATIKASWVAADVGLDDIPTDCMDNSLSGLIHVLNYYLGNQPNLTRAFHKQVGLFFEHGDRAATTGRITALFLNNEGENNAADPVFNPAFIQF